MISRYNRADTPWGQGGGQPCEQDVQAAFEFGSVIVRSQNGGEAAEQGKFAGDFRRNEAYHPD
jgi:hypothetical protein